MEILVFGAGAVGGYLGGLLAYGGYDVTLVARGQAAAAIQKHGLTILKETQQFYSQPKVVTSFRQAVVDQKSYDLILVCMKSYDVAAAVNEMVAFYPKPPTVITLQNGIGIEEMFINEFGPENIIAGSLTTPLSHEAYRTIMVERIDRGLALSPTEAGQNINRWVNLFIGVGVDTIGIEDYRSMKWSKALLNMIGNATSAILNRHPRVIYNFRPTFKIERDMLKETAAVMKGLKVRGVDLPGVTTGRLLTSIKWLPNSVLQPNLAKIIAEGRGNKLPSFHLDLVSGKSENEVTYHNGTVAKIGDSLNIPTPVNTALNDILMKLVHKEVDYGLYDGKPKRLVAEVSRYQEEAKEKKKRDKKKKKKK
jgi:2-dehydropantoate 2-reductase